MSIISVEKIKKSAIIALVSNDYLMDTLVLKGGNAIDLIFSGAGRASIDLDFSIPEDFKPESITKIESDIRRSLHDTFFEEGYSVFDVKFIKNPPVEHGTDIPFWGGYRIEFKIIANELYELKKDNLNYLRKFASITGANTKKTFTIDISKYEYCNEKTPFELDGYTVYVYTTEMIIIEKIRAICQQNPKYREIVHSHQSSGRAKDFFDIYFLNERHHIDFTSQRILSTLQAVFETKKVPLEYLNEVALQKEIHNSDFNSLKDTVTGTTTLESFEYYFNYVQNILKVISSKIL